MTQYVMGPAPFLRAANWLELHGHPVHAAAVRALAALSTEPAADTSTVSKKPGPVEHVDQRVNNLCSEINALRANIAEALEYAKDGQIDGAHHKLWAIDQIVRALTGDQYTTWVDTYCGGEDGPDTYEWDVGIPP